jgi:hypothetical protein
MLYARGNSPKQPALLAAASTLPAPALKTHAALLCQLHRSTQCNAIANQAASS